MYEKLHTLMDGNSPTISTAPRSLAVAASGLYETRHMPKEEGWWKLSNLTWREKIVLIRLNDIGNYRVCDDDDNNEKEIME